MNRTSWILVLLLLVVQSIAQPVSVSAQGTSAPTISQSIIRYDSIHHPVAARRGMVVSQNELASEVGQQILERGGNAVDAAVAMGFALAVSLPRAGNLGGSGFMLVNMAGSDEVTALDFRSAAPAAARTEYYLDADGELDTQAMTFGARAPGVPGSVAGLAHAWNKFGSMSWVDLVEPALKMASDGIIVSDDLAYVLAEAMSVMSHYPSSIAAYAKGIDDPYASGELLVQEDLAWSLEQIQLQGADAFYSGAIADKVVAYMEQAGGYISASDLENYAVRERTAIETQYRDHRIVTMPPSSIGGIAMLQMFNVLQEFDLAAHPQGGAKSLHLIAETMKRVNANRREGIGDTDFVDVPIKGMLSKTLAEEIAASIDEHGATPASQITPTDAVPYESRETTHFSVVDSDGNAVSTTYTLGYSFGSGLVIPGTGILLDNQVRNFSHRDPDHANAMEPGKRVVSTMTPTLVFDADNELLIVTGTPGGGRIHTTILQLLLNVIDYDMNIAEATHVPRIYQGWRSPELGVELGINADTISLLESMGHDVEQQQTMGSTQSIMRLDGILYGSADPRRPGAMALGID